MATNQFIVPNPYKDYACWATVGKSGGRQLVCGLDARKYTVKRRDTLRKFTAFDGPLVVWFCEHHKAEADKRGWDLTLTP